MNIIDRKKAYAKLKVKLQTAQEKIKNGAQYINMMTYFHEWAFQLHNFYTTPII
jgi:hypothetical protein